MRNHPCMRTGLAALLTVALSVACVPGALALAQGESAKELGASNASAQPASTATYRKSEVVYANLAASGKPEAVYVVNRFDVTGAGSIADYGDYTAVQNLTNRTDLKRQGNATVFEAGEGAFFYQGDAARTALPWSVSLEYKLDGKTVSADQLAGASGALSIRVGTARNDAVPPAFYDSFMMQITFTLPGAAASDVTAEGATVASAGQDTTVAFTVLPGHNGNFELKAQVKDFHMAGAQIAALPYSSVIEMPDTSGMADGMTSLSDAVSQLAAGASSLASGASALSSGVQELSSGTTSFGQGLAQLDSSSGALVGASSQIKTAFDAMSAVLSKIDPAQLEQLKQLPYAIDQIADGLEAVARQTHAVQQEYAQAMTALDGAIGGLLANAPTQDQIDSLKEYVKDDPSQAETVQKLLSVREAAQAVKAAYVEGKPAFDDADNALSASAAALDQQVTALRAIGKLLEAAVADGRIDQLVQAVEGLSQLSASYGQFHDGLVQYTSGVSALAASYGNLESGTSSLAGGASQLSGGAGSLSGGLGQLNATTITLPETMRKQIEEMTAEFDFPKFDPVSFVSSDNKNVAAVQFVMSTAAIEKPEASQEEELKAEPTLWDRFLALFQG
ncbi:hypothetical protein [Paraeggerthella hongkongensis]|uniref:YhgE/Pip domain-containing protein n=1 Tax=Paraeggerthella hongkongensis TaxID=230658 RepID=A0A3N0BF03_9ACTN|nr:hypothetical protein [Paraeggerthella hongkongensis]RNL45753.1 hypothetical protein DMP08_05370 [Paraeggerthella hongkongensis]